MKIQKDSRGTVYRVSAVCLTLTVLSFIFIKNPWVMWPLVIIFLWFTWFIIFFFRVPERERPQGEGLVTSIADGKVVIVEKVFEKEYLKRDCIQISVYMNFFNVHTNFWPFDGITTYSKYHPGKYLLAFMPKASELNEHASASVKYGDSTYKGAGAGTEILFKQIAGTFARRIVNYAHVGDSFEGGDQCGVIKFGSRLDIFLPLDAEILVKVGDKVKSIETPIARLK